MADKDRKSAYDADLKDAKWLVEGVVDEGYQLEDILSEFGGGVLKEEPPVPEEPKPEPPKPVAEKGQKGKVVLFPRGEAVPPPEEPAEEEEGEEPPPPTPPVPDPDEELSVEELVSRAIDEVREEEAALPEKKRRWLFSRRKAEDTERLYDGAPEPEPEQPEEEPIGPEEDLRDVAYAARRRWKRQKVQLPIAAVLTVLMVALLVLVKQDFAVLTELGRDHPRVGR